MKPIETMSQTSGLRFLGILLQVTFFMRVILSRFLLLIIALLMAACVLADHFTASLHRIPLSLLLGSTLLSGFLAGRSFHLLKRTSSQHKNRRQITYQQIIRTEQEIVDWMITYVPQQQAFVSKRHLFSRK
ncbi:MAG: hypothetical protein IPP74_04780 [Alphaproteobacteria bacterium]|nr:hypothetical protein [Alphaproteobacteria bacterium]